MADEGPTTELEVWAREVGQDLGMWINWLESRAEQLSGTMVRIRRTGLDVPQAFKTISTMHTVLEGMLGHIKEFKRIEKIDG